MSERYLRRGAPAPTCIRIVRRGSSEPETTDAETAYHLLSRGAGELEDPSDVEALRLLEETGQRLLERQARELTRDGLLF